MKFKCRSGEYYLAHDDHAILFASKEGNDQIICHNCKRLNDKYYLDEPKSNLGEPGQYFEETEPLTLRYRLTGVRNGRYILKQRMVGPAAVCGQGCGESGHRRDQAAERRAGSGAFQRTASGGDRAQSHRAGSVRRQPADEAAFHLETCS